MKMKWIATGMLVFIAAMFAIAFVGCGGTGDAVQQTETTYDTYSN